MSNAFAALARINDSGQIPVVIGSGALPADTNYFQGLPLNTNGEVLGSTASKVRVDNGIPYDADGRVCFKLEPTAYVNGSIPYAATGELAATNDSPSGASGGMPFANGGFSIGSGNTPPIPPLRPLSKLKYTFTQTNLEAAITDRVGGVNKLETFIGTDVNAVQTIDGGIRTFKFGENLLPASLLDWAGTGGLFSGNPVFTNDTGLGEVEITIASDGERVILRSNFDVPEGVSTFSQVVLDAGTIEIAPSDVLVEIGSGTLVEARLNGSAINANVARQFFAGDLLELVYNFAVADSVQMRLGIGVSTANTVAGMSIKLTQPMVNTGTERGPFVQPDGNPVVRYQQAFDVGVGALIEPSAVNLLPASLLARDGNPAWTGTGGTISGSSPVFSNDTGLGEVFIAIVANLQRNYLRSDFSVSQAGAVTLSAIVLEAGSTDIPPSQVILPVGTGVSSSLYIYKVNGLAVPPSDPYTFSNDDLLEVTLTYLSSATSQARFGIGVATGTTLIDGMSIKLTQPQIEAGTQRSSFIQPNGAPAQRDASTPQVTSAGLADSETVVYNEYINLQQLDDTVRAMWFYGSEVDNAVIGTICLETGEGAQIQMVRVLGDGSVLPVLPVIMEQGINVGDRVLVASYLKADLFTLLVENKTTGETKYAQDAAIAGTIGGTGLAPIGLGDLGFIASTFIHKKIDFEVTEYTDPPLPDFIDNGDFDLTSGDFADG